MDELKLAREMLANIRNKSLNKLASVENTNTQDIPISRAESKRQKLGRPRTSTQLRKLIQKTLNEPHPDKPEMTRLQIMICQMMVSRSARDHTEILNRAFGKVKELVEIDDKRISDEDRITRIVALLDRARARRDGLLLTSGEQPSTITVETEPADTASSASADQAGSETV